MGLALVLAKRLRGVPGGIARRRVVRGSPFLGGGVVMDRDWERFNEQFRETPEERRNRLRKIRGLDIAPPTALKPPIAKPEMLALEVATRTLEKIFRRESGQTCREALDALRNIETLVPTAKGWR